MKLQLFSLFTAVRFVTFASPILDSLVMTKSFLNKTQLSGSDLKFIENQAKFQDDRLILESVKNEKRFFNHKVWKVELIFKTLLLTYYNKAIVRVSFNDFTGEVSINGQNFKIKNSKSIWSQIKPLFEKNRSVSNWYALYIESAQAKEEALFDIKKFLIFSLLKHSTVKEIIEKSFKSELLNKSMGLHLLLIAIFQSNFNYFKYPIRT